MADVTPIVPAGRQIIQSYGNGGFRISGVTVTGSVVVLPDSTAHWAAEDLADIALDSLSAVIDADPRVEVLLIGTGRQMAAVDPALRQALSGHRIVADVMDTGAACRTFNVLVAEDRRVAAALLAVP